jgi:hypothetical protein
MLSHGVPVIDYVQLWVDNKTGKPSELVYVVEKFGVFRREEELWVVFDSEETAGMYNDTRIITVEKEDAKELMLVEDFDSGKKIDIAAVAEYETGKYYD